MTAQIWLLAGITFLMLTAAALLVMTVQARKLKVSAADFSRPGESPLRLVLLSDLHISKMPIHWDYIGTKISKADPDFVVVTGDLIFSRKDGPAVLSFFRLLITYVDCPVYITYGNHDNNKLFHRDPALKRAFTQELEGISHRIHVIERKTVTFSDRQRNVVICGLPDFQEGETDWESQVQGAREQADRLSAVLLIASHSPELLTRLKDGCANLGVFGHYHDGQVHLPGRAEFRLLRRADKLACQGYIYGCYIYKGTPIYITSGLGNTNLAIRYGSTPEIVVITF